MSAPPHAAGGWPEPDLDRRADTYRRRIRLDAPEPGVVEAGLEDDFHHFLVTLRHDGARVTDVVAGSVRAPWTTCPAAGAVLHDLVGMPLAPRFTAAAATSDPRHHCTHQFDLAAHAITHAFHGRRRRQYDAEIPRRVDWYARVRLWVDGELRLTWQLQQGGLADPEPPFDAAPWKGGFMRWADETLPPDDAEQAIVLRRACDIGMGRGMPLDDLDDPTPLRDLMLGICYTMQPGTIDVALRNKGLIRDFADAPDRLLRGALGAAGHAAGAESTAG